MEFKNLLSIYNEAPKIGLKAIGNTSYLNTILQCLANNYELANYFLDQKEQSFIKNKVKEMPLSFVISRLFIHLYPDPQKGDKRPYGTEKILTVMGKLNAIYNCTSKRNINDAIIFILNKIHEELNSKKDDYQNLDIDIFNSNSVVENEIIKFTNTNESIISNLFTFFEKKENHCSLCNKTKYELLHFNTFDLDILKCSKKCGNIKISIYDCFNLLSSPKSKKFYCINCKRQTQINAITRIYSSPNMFIFLLEREDDMYSLSIEFIIEKKINLKDYIECKNTPLMFELVSIISIDLKEKKYVAFSKSQIDNKWYLYSDENVQFIEDDSVLQNNNNINLYIPCMLFYKSSQ